MLSPEESEYNTLAQGEFIPYLTFTSNLHSYFGLTGSSLDCLTSTSLDLSRIQFLLTNAVEYYPPFYCISFLPHCHCLMEMTTSSGIGRKYNAKMMTVVGRQNVPISVAETRWFPSQILENCTSNPSSYSWSGCWIGNKSAINWVSIYYSAAS